MEFTGQQPASITEQVLLCADYLECRASETDNGLLEVSSELATLRSKRTLTRDERVRKAELEEAEYGLYRAKLELDGQLAELLDVASAYEDGVTTQAELICLINTAMPPSKAEDTSSLSKRKLAIREANLRDAQSRGIEPNSWEFEWMYGKDGTRETDDIALRTDPRRLATGRAATRVVTDGTLDTFNGFERFMYATTDTHGGKSRGPGKNGKSFVSKSGKRVRKR